MYEILKLDEFGKNDHAVYCADGEWKHIDGKENPVLFLSIKDAEDYLTLVKGVNYRFYHICKRNEIPPVVDPIKNLYERKQHHDATD
jgi:hypothetical protein